MADWKLGFDLVLNTTLPTNYTAVMKVENALDCAHTCMRQSTCEAMAFSILNLVCVLFQGSIQEDLLVPANTEVLAYNLVRAGSCIEPVGSIPGPAYAACPLGRGFSYELALNVCYKMVTSSNPTQNATCVQEGGSDLLMIDTREKLDFFKQLLPALTYIRGNRVVGTVEWIYWEGGLAKPLSVLEWAPGQPDNLTAGQNCMGMNAKGQRDLICSRAYWPSLCEYDMQ